MSHARIETLSRGTGDDRSLGFVTRPFRTIGMRLGLQPRLNTALTHIYGQPLAVRPIENRDASLLAALLTRLSEQSCWLRYNCPRLAPEAVQSETQRVLGRDPAHAVALIVIVRQGRAKQAIALAELVAIDSDMALAIIVVDDDCQGQGLGRALLRQIVALASRRGLRRLQFDIRRENRAMQGLVRSLELPYHCQYWPDEICLWVELTAPIAKPYDLLGHPSPPIPLSQVGRGGWGVRVNAERCPKRSLDYALCTLEADHTTVEVV